MEVWDQIPEHLLPGAPPPVGGPGDNECEDERGETKPCREYESDEELHV
jgi:hypothetical protein